MVDKRKGEERRASLSGEKEPHQEALDRYDQILAKDPTSLVFAAVAESYRKKGELERAIATCRKGLRLHPRFVSGRVALARAYADSGNLDLAQQELEKVVLAAPDNIVAQKLLAGIYKKGSHLDLLEKTLHRILALDAGDEHARKGLEGIREEKKRETAPGDPPRETQEILTGTLAEIYANQGYFDRAYAIYEKMSLREPGNAMFHERLAELKEKLISRIGRTRARNPEEGSG